MAKTQEKPMSREDLLASICSEINKGQFGGEEHDAVTWLGSRDSIPLERFSSGCPALDDALGGGWPKGRQMEVFGPESSGKTTLALHAVAEYQKKYPEDLSALVDTEYAFDETYAQAIGVDTHFMIVHQPDSGVQALNIINQLIEKGIMFIIVDSVAALVPKEEMGEELGNSTVGAQARMMSQALRRITTEAGKRGVTIFWTNQVREKIGIMYGDPTTTPAGHALKHYASIRAAVRRSGAVKEKVDGEEVIVSVKTVVDVKKNKCAPPFRKAEFVISFGHGIDTVAAILDQCIENGSVEKRGAWFSFDGQLIGQGRMNVMENMRTNESLMKSLAEASTNKKQAPKKEKPVVATSIIGDDEPEESEEVEVTEVLNA